jgi:hypothetical protein
MKYVFALVAAISLAGCAPNVALRDPATGATVSCGSYTMIGLGDHTLTPRESRCVAQYQSRGYVLQPRPGSTAP